MLGEECSLSLKHYKIRRSENRCCIRTEQPPNLLRIERTNINTCNVGNAGHIEEKMTTVRQELGKPMRRLWRFNSGCFSRLTAARRNLKQPGAGGRPKHDNAV